MKTSTGIILLIVLIAVGGLILYGKDKPTTYNSGNDTATNTPSDTKTVTPPPQSPSQEPSPTIKPDTKAITITYTDAGFAPGVVTIDKGTTVTFVNKSSGQMWVGSDPHPIHTDFSGTTTKNHCPDVTATAFDQCGTGTSFSFTFDKIGSWKYHNHVSASKVGVIIVK